MSEWKTVPLRNLLEGGQVSYGVVQPGIDSSTGVPIVRVKDIRNGLIDTSTPMRVGKDISDRHRRTLLSGGELLLSLVGTVGEVAVVPDVLNGWNVARAVAVVRSSVVSSRWLQLCFESPAVKSELDSLLNTTVQSTLNLSDLKRIGIPVPPKGVRDAIEEVLGALDDKIAANTKLTCSIIELLELETQTRWLAEGADATTAISDLLQLNPATARPSESEPVYVDMRKLPESGNGITDWQYREAKGGARFRNRDTLLARITPCLENRKTGYVDFLGDGQVGIGSTEFIVLRSRAGVPQPLSYFIGVNSDFRDFAIRHMVGTSGRQRVSANDLAGFLVPSPDSDWLTDFGARATCSFEFMKCLRDENRTLAATRGALLPQLMSGKLQVKDAEKTLEGVL
jgi:type I restriction enzyme S subunit